MRKSEFVCSNHEHTKEAECRCVCHDPGKIIMHCMPCCYECEECGKSIRGEAWKWSQEEAEGAE